MEKIMTAVKGFVVGGTMLVPGVSGGSMAMVLGVYDALISSVSSFFKHVKKSLMFLLLFCAGALLGLLLVSKPLGLLMERYPVVLMYFFMGAVAGSIPMILRKARVGAYLRGASGPGGDRPKGGIRPGRLGKGLLFLLGGFLIVFFLGFLPSDLLDMEAGTLQYNLIMIVAGIVAAIALVLPGISVSHMFLMLGLYGQILELLGGGFSARWLSMIPLGIGLAGGIILTTKLLETAMDKYPAPSYLAILGFLLGSIYDVFPPLPTGGQIPLCIVLFCLGFGVIFFLAKMEERHEGQEG